MPAHPSPLIDPTFIPFDPEDRRVRFFARPIGFDMECPKCGRLFLVGPRRRDNALYNRVTGVLTCRRHWNTGRQGCGRRWLIGIVAWGITCKPSRRGQPSDHRPTARQLAELREAGRGIWPQLQKRSRGDAINKIEPDLSTELTEDDL